MNFLSLAAGMLLASDAGIALAGAISILVCLGAGLGMGLAVSKSVEAIGRQPEASDKIRTTLILGLAFIETTAIYGLVISFLILFV